MHPDFFEAEESGFLFLAEMYTRRFLLTEVD
jgi:hypothetical protein